MEVKRGVAVLVVLALMGVTRGGDGPPHFFESGGRTIICPPHFLGPPST